jgi:hypothetical protein
MLVGGGDCMFAVAVRGHSSVSTSRPAAPGLATAADAECLHPLDYAEGRTRVRPTKSRLLKPLEVRELLPDMLSPLRSISRGRAVHLGAAV